MTICNLEKSCGIRYQTENGMIHRRPNACNRFVYAHTRPLYHLMYAFPTEYSNSVSAPFVRLDQYTQKIDSRNTSSYDVERATNLHIRIIVHKNYRFKCIRELCVRRNLVNSCTLQLRYHTHIHAQRPLKCHSCFWLEKMRRIWAYFSA